MQKLAVKLIVNDCGKIVCDCLRSTELLHAYRNNVRANLPFLCTDGAHRGIARTSVYLDVQHAEVISQRQMNEPMLPHKAGQ